MQIFPAFQGNSTEDSLDNSTSFERRSKRPRNLRAQSGSSEDLACARGNLCPSSDCPQDSEKLPGANTDRSVNLDANSPDRDIQGPSNAPEQQEGTREFVSTDLQLTDSVPPSQLDTLISNSNLKNGMIGPKDTRGSEVSEPSAAAYGFVRFQDCSDSILKENSGYSRRLQQALHGFKSRQGELRLPSSSQSAEYAQSLRTFAPPQPGEVEWVIEDFANRFLLGKLPPRTRLWGPVLKRGNSLCRLLVFPRGNQSNTFNAPKSCSVFLAAQPLALPSKSEKAEADKCGCSASFARPVVGQENKLLELLQDSNVSNLNPDNTTTASSSFDKSTIPAASSPPPAKEGTATQNGGRPDNHELTNNRCPLESQETAASANSANDAVAVITGVPPLIELNPAESCLICPTGKSLPGQSSPWLDDPAGSPSQTLIWSMYRCSYSLAAINWADHKNESLQKSDFYTFCSTENDRGWPDFLPIERLQVGDFLGPNGELVLRASLAPRPAEFAVSFRQTIPGLRLSGLRNPGATCYLNCMVQALFHLGAFRRAIFLLSKSEDKRMVIDMVAPKGLRNPATGGWIPPGTPLSISEADLTEEDIKDAFSTTGTGECRLQYEESMRGGIKASAQGVNLPPPNSAELAPVSSNRSMSGALQRLFLAMSDGVEAASTTELLASFGWGTADTLMQHDAQEFNRLLCDRLEELSRKTPAEGLIRKLFLGTFENYIRCLDVKYESVRCEEYYDLQVDVDGVNNIYDSLEKYCSEEILDGDNLYLAEGFGKQRARKGVRFVSFPPVLQFHLKRFKFDPYGLTMVKQNSRFEYPFLLDMNRVVPGAGEYELASVIVHSGDVGGGHYFVITRPFGGRLWVKLDDDKVTPVSSDAALEDSYGGHEKLAVLTRGLNGPAERAAGNMKLQSAYILFYVKRDISAALLQAPHPSVINPYFKERNRRENLIKERKERIRKLVERSIKVRFVTQRSLRGYPGFLTDLASLPAVYEQRFPSNTTLLDLYKSLLEKMAPVLVKQGDMSFDFVDRRTGQYRHHLGLWFFDSPLSFKSDYATLHPMPCEFGLFEGELATLNLHLLWTREENRCRWLPMLTILIHPLPAAAQLPPHPLDSRTLRGLGHACSEATQLLLKIFCPCTCSHHAKALDRLDFSTELCEVDTDDLWLSESLSVDCPKCANAFESQNIFILGFGYLPPSATRPTLAKCAVEAFLQVVGEAVAAQRKALMNSVTFNDKHCIIDGGTIDRQLQHLVCSPRTDIPRMLEDRVYLEREMTFTKIKGNEAEIVELMLLHEHRSCDWPTACFVLALPGPACLQKPKETHVIVESSPDPAPRLRFRTVEENFKGRSPENKTRVSEDLCFDGISPIGVPAPWIKLKYPTFLFSTPDQWQQAILKKSITITISCYDLVTAFARWETAAQVPKTAHAASQPVQQSRAANDFAAPLLECPLVVDLRWPIALAMMHIAKAVNLDGRFATFSAKSLGRSDTYFACPPDLAVPSTSEVDPTQLLLTTSKDVILDHMHSTLARQQNKMAIRYRRPMDVREKHYNSQVTYCVTALPFRHCCSVPIRIMNLRAENVGAVFVPVSEILNATSS